MKNKEKYAAYNMRTKKKETEYIIQIKHCQKCVNNCPLDNPKCITGIEKAKTEDLYDQVPVENKSIFKNVLKRISSKYGKNLSD